MTLYDINETIRQKAAAHGFETRDTTWSRYPEIVAENVNFSIFDHISCDWKTRSTTLTLQFRTSVSRMGGDPSVDELLATADEIKRAAELTADLQAENLSYIEVY